MNKYSCRIVCHRTVLSIIFVIALLSATFVITKSKKNDVKRTYKVIKKTIVDEIKVIGIADTEVIKVGTITSGQIEKIHVQLGQKVNKGDLLVTLENKLLPDEIEAKKIQLAASKADINANETSCRILREKFNKMQILFKKGIVSQYEYNEILLQYELSEAKLKKSESDYYSANVELKKKIEELEGTNVRAPISGTVVHIPISEGQTILSSSNATTLIGISDLTNMKVKLLISVCDVNKISVGMKTTCRLSNSNVETVIDSIDPGSTAITRGEEINSKEPVYYFARVNIHNNDNMIKIGMSIPVTIHVKESNEAFIVPYEAINNDNGKKYVNILQEGKNVRKEITTGIVQGLNVEVTSGIDENDEIVY